MMRCDQRCLKRYQERDSKRFRPRGGSRFQACQTAFTECCTGVYSPGGLCAKIARRKGKA